MNVWKLNNFLVSFDLDLDQKSNKYTNINQIGSKYAHKIDLTFISLSFG